MYALIYCRVSSERQKREGHGLEAQEARCREYAEKKGYVVEPEAVFKDSASGGGDYTTRPGQVRILEVLDTNPHRSYMVLVDEISRLARDAAAHIGYRAELRQRGIEVESPNFNFEDSAEGEMIEGVMAVASQYQRRSNQRQVVQKQKARLEAGYNAFPAKRGYLKQKDPIIHGKIDAPDPKWLDVLKEGLEGFAHGKFTRKVDLCAFLVEKGFYGGKRPEKFIDNATKMLKDPFYAGFIEFPKWEVSRRKGKHQAIISPDTFELNQKRLGKADFNKRVRMDINPDYPLRGLLTCDHCGNHLTAGPTKGRNRIHHYYVCHHKPCPYYGKSIKKEDIEDKFDEELQKGKLKANVGKLVRRVFDATWDVEVANFEKRLVLMTREKAELEEKAKGLTELYLGTKSSKLKRVYEKQLEGLADEIEEAEERMPGEKLDLSIPYRTALGKATGMLQNPQVVWHGLTTKEQQELFFFIFQEKLPYNQETGYRTDKTPQAVMLFGEFAGPKTQDVEMVGVEPTSKTD